MNKSTAPEERTRKTSCRGNISRLNPRLSPTVILCSARGSSVTLSPKSLSLPEWSVGLERKPSHWFWDQNSNTQFKPALKSLDLIWWLVTWSPWTAVSTTCDRKSKHPFLLFLIWGTAVWIVTKLDCQNADNLCLYFRGIRGSLVHKMGEKGRAPHLCYFILGGTYKILGSSTPVPLTVWSPDRHWSELPLLTVHSDKRACPRPWTHC